MDGAWQIAFPLGAFHHVGGCPDRELAETRALSGNPAIQLRGPARYEAAFEEPAAIKL